jgi:hypothetical protein
MLPSPHHCVLSQISGVAGVVVASAEDSSLAWKRSVSAAAMATVLPRLADEVEFAAGVGDAYDNALAESVIGLFKTELIKPRGPWRTAEQVELATSDGFRVAEQQMPAH